MKWLAQGIAREGDKKLKPAFLTAQWRFLVMLNFPVDVHVLEAHVPRGTEIDSWNGTTYVSLVAFSFIDTRVKGLGIPLHRDFEEINLRFYVRSSCPERRRGVWCILPDGGQPWRTVARIREVRSARVRSRLASKASAGCAAPGMAGASTR